jgi:2-succinyl-5-enolpyruvyl-6-hydroxy-3-cyclohexene-1-carboxylate synthase
MTTEQHTATLTHWVATIVQALVSAGITDAVVSPGSRSTPLALALARHPQIRIWMHYDERSAGFFALGIGRQRGTPALLLCTSGTAAANYLPAVAEADLSRIPLLVLTADRPHELRDNGAPQTINQVRIFGTTTRWFSDLPEPTDAAPLRTYLVSTIARAVAATSAHDPGPVHLNLPFREPLVPDRELLAQLYAAPAPHVRVTTGVPTLRTAEVVDLAVRLGQTHRGLIICGPDCPHDLAPAVTALAVRLGFPILADPLSGVRCGPHDQALVLGAYDAFLRVPGFATRYAPELVLRFGAMPTSKPVLQFLQQHPTTRQIVVDRGAGWREPTSLATEHLHTDERLLCDALLTALSGGINMPLTLWSRPWLNAERITRQVIAAHLAEQTTLSEPRIFAELAAMLPSGASLFVANSMPVRDLDTFFGPSSTPICLLGNRGANGIDGLVSTALGAVAAGSGPMVLAIGDLALYHDMNGLLAAKLHQLSLTIVLINNDGGGIFSFLPQASEHDHFELLFGTPHGLNFAPLADMYGANYTHVTDWESFRVAVSGGMSSGGLHIVEARTTRPQNVRDHRVIWPQVQAALEQAGLTS